MQYLTSVMRGQTTQEQLAVVGVGEGCSETKIETLKVGEKEKLKAAELIGKRYRMWTDKIDTDTTATVVFEGEDELED